MRPATTYGLPINRRIRALPPTPWARFLTRHDPGVRNRAHEVGGSALIMRLLRIDPLLVTGSHCASSKVFRSHCPQRLVGIVMERPIRAFEPIGSRRSANIEGYRVFERFGRVLNARRDAQQLVRHQRYVSTR